MNVLKNFEALFLVALGLACAANYVFEPAPQQRQVAVANHSSTAGMPVVVVSAKRLSAEQKRQSLREERRDALLAAASSSKI